MFPDEFAVLVDAEGGLLSLFAPRTRVRLSGQPPTSGSVDGQLRVELLDQDADFGVVAFPAPTFEGGRTAKVRRRLLEAQ